ncbi:hypothetical protein PR202_ga19585 [Eleusine coracana subsp. coracana]|uniref:Thioredoxin domain-containing protein n=1 Tax=Eleusine coracana subsp. coracana TaxID=191504 RepID=A0AAV5CVZ7_ELECO|nr:hypothetical protein PR202_ga19585 [Eleusine coracana subsp. coracana]
MASALAVSVPVASAYAARRGSCAVPASSSRSLRSPPLRAAAGIFGSRLGRGRRAFVVRAVQGDAAIDVRYHVSITWCVLINYPFAVPNVSKSTWQSLVMESDLPVLVEFSASWCGPCKMIHPIVVKLSKEYEGKLKCFKLDTDESPDIASQYGVRSIPTMMIFKNGEKKDAVIGAVTESTLVTSIEKFV